MTMTPTMRRSCQALAASLLLALAANPADAVPERAATPRAGRDAAPRFHLRLVKSEPAKAQVLSTSPTVIRLWFSLAPEMAVTAVKLSTADGTAIPLSAPRRGRAAKDPIEVDIKQSLPPGEYLVSWKTSSKDGHPITGDFSFTVKAGA